MGRALLSVFFVVVLGSVVVWNIPDSGLKSATVGAVRPFVEVVGLDQNWSVFAPNPRRMTLDLSARIDFADGSSTTWQLPLHADPILTPYRTYRWQKWMEHVRSDENTGLWDPAAKWLAERYADEGTVVQVTLIRHWYDTPPPGESGERPAWNEYAFHTYAPPGATP